MNEIKKVESGSESEFDKALNREIEKSLEQEIKENKKLEKRFRNFIIFCIIILLSILSFVTLAKDVKPIKDTSNIFESKDVIEIEFDILSEIVLDSNKVPYAVSDFAKDEDRFVFNIYLERGVVTSLYTDLFNPESGDKIDNFKYVYNKSNETVTFTVYDKHDLIIIYNIRLNFLEIRDIYNNNVIRRYFYRRIIYTQY